MNNATKTAKYRYYLLMHPPMPGSIPKPAGNRVIALKDFDDREWVESIQHVAWGWVEYENPLNEKDICNYELKKGA